ncbi:MAG TPA: folate-binding protein [Rudaea sp.]|jgi:hypothetical protein|nr:folate-binding protein [Rudaea sp.]
MNLSPFPIIELTGADAAAFAHAQFSNDVAALADNHWQWNAWLTPQGRVRAFFALLRLDPENLMLILRGGDAAALADALRRYVLRAKVTIRVADFGAVGIDDPNDLATLGVDLPETNSITRNGAASAIAMSDGKRWIVLGAPHEQVGANRQRWTLADIRAGIPEIAPTLYEEALPYWLGLIRLGAVSVKKGCYPGQEITSRLHFKGGNKRSLYRVTFDPHFAVVAGTPIVTGNGERVGQIVMDSDGEALAIIAHAAADEPLHFEETPQSLLVARERFD